jgi:bla regulator protein blaR1
MPTMILTLDGWAEGWLKVMGAVLWQSTLLVALAAAVAWCMRRSSPVVRYWLWQIVAIKLLLMPFWTLAIPLPGWPESRPLGQATAFQPTEDADNRPERLMRPQPLPFEQGPGKEGTARVASVDETPVPVTWQAWLLAVWFAIVLWQFARIVGQRMRLARLLGQAVPASGELAGLVAELAGHIGLRRVPGAVSVAGECPLFVCGLWRPRLVFPSQLLASLDSAKRRQVILHELAHVKRHDLVWGWPVEIARIIYFFHPLVYWVAYQLRLEQELACDQLAMARSGHSAADYAQTLVQVASHAFGPAAVQAAAIVAGLAGSQAPPKMEQSDVQEGKKERGVRAR